MATVSHIGSGNMVGDIWGHVTGRNGGQMSVYANTHNGAHTCIFQEGQMSPQKKPYILHIVQLMRVRSHNTDRFQEYPVCLECWEKLHT